MFRAFTSDLYGKIDLDVFISTIAVLYSDDKPLLLKFVSHVYDGGHGVIERQRMEDMLQTAYGDRLRGKWEVIFKINQQLFRTSSAIPVREFEQWHGRIDLFIDWVVQVLKIFIEPVPSISASREISDNDLMNTFRVTSQQFAAIKSQFLSFIEDIPRNINSPRNNNSLSLGDIKAVFAPYLSELLCEVVFVGKQESFHPVWTLGDWLDFVLTYRGPMDQRLAALLSAFRKYADTVAAAQDSNQDSSSGWFERMVRILAQPMPPLQQEEEGEQLEEPALDSTATASDAEDFLVPPPSRTRTRSRSHAAAQGMCMSTQYLSALSLPIPVPLADDLAQFLTAPYCTESAVSFLLTQLSLLSGVRDICLAAGCLGLPPSALEEKEFITELTVRHMGHGRTPYGVQGTAWCVVSKVWYDSWRLFVGQGTPTARRRPGPIDNHPLMKSSASRALRPLLVIGVDIEVLSPLAFKALERWYGGGPEVCRRVIRRNRGKRHDPPR